MLRYNRFRYISICCHIEQTISSSKWMLSVSSSLEPYAFRLVVTRSHLNHHRVKVLGMGFARYCPLGSFTELEEFLYSGRVWEFTRVWICLKINVSGINTILNLIRFLSWIPFFYRVALVINIRNHRSRITQT